MSRIGYWDNAERRTTFRDLLKAYDMYGWKARIKVPFPMDGVLVDQRGEGPGAIFVLQLEPKISWFQFCMEAGFTDTGGHPTSSRSEQTADRLFEDLNRLGFIERGQTDYVTHMWGQWINVELLDLQRGQPVEYVEDDQSGNVASIKSTPGIVQKVVKGKDDDWTSSIIELFLVHPISWVRIPRAMDTDYLKPEHVSAWTDRVVVRSTYLNWKEKSPETLPPGNMASDNKEFIFDTPIPLQQVQNFCALTVKVEGKQVKNPYGGEIDERVLRCWLGAAMFHIVPIVRGHSGTFRPMRMEVARESIPYVVTKKDIDDAMKRGEHFEQNPVYPPEWHHNLKVGDFVRIRTGRRAGHLGYIEAINVDAGWCRIVFENEDWGNYLEEEFTKETKYKNLFEDNPIFPKFWEDDSGLKIPYNVDKLREFILSDIMKYKPWDLKTDDTYSLWLDTIASGALGVHIPQHVAQFFGIEIGDDEFEWEDIDNHADKVATKLNELLNLPGNVAFGTHETDGDYGLMYIFSEGDHPEFDAQ